MLGFARVRPPSIVAPAWGLAPGIGDRLALCVGDPFIRLSLPSREERVLRCTSRAHSRAGQGLGWPRLCPVFHPAISVRFRGPPYPLDGAGKGAGVKCPSPMPQCHPKSDGQSQTTLLPRRTVWGDCRKRTNAERFGHKKKKYSPFVRGRATAMIRRGEYQITAQDVALQRWDGRSTFTAQFCDSRHPREREDPSVWFAHRWRLR